MTVFRSSNRPASLRGRVIDLWESLILSGDFIVMIVMMILLLMPLLGLQVADWPLKMNIVGSTVVASVIFGYFLSRSRYNELFALIVSAIYGLVIVFLIAGLDQSANPLRGMEIVIERAGQWLYDALTGGINQDNLMFTLVVSILFWFFGYNAAWHIFRIDRVWRVIIPPGLILLVNMVIYTGEADLDRYLLLFAFMSLLLIVRSNLEAREWNWYITGVRVPKRLRRQFLLVGATISLLALVLAWSVPTGDLQERLDNFQRFLASEPLRRMAEFWNRLVEPVEAEGPATADYYGGDSLNLGGAIRLGDQVIMVIEAPTEHRYYWRSRVFERYGDGRWSPSATRRVPDFVAPLEVIPPEEGNLGRIQVRQTVTMNIPTRLFYTAPQPLSVSLPGRIDLLRTSDNQDDAEAPMNVSVIRPRRVIERGQAYDAMSLLSLASAHDLRNVGMDYPGWVANPNSYPGGISGRVSTLARQIVTDAGAVNPYDQSKAIETWLRTNIIYNETIPSPPSGVDPVEWLLFDIQQGYCTYYATAMVQMLRSLGIPARMAAGFSEGDYDPELGQYVIRERDAHTWVEVYFPGYGWVEFEPTAAEAPLNRDGDDIAPQNSPASAPTSVPTNTPTPQPSPTPFLTPTPDDQSGSDDPDALPTTTLTPSPTPTVTPVIVPTVQPPIQPPSPPQSGLLSFLLPAIGFALLVLISIITLVLLIIFIWWWWEWRGMGGLSPVTRAYARLERYLSLIGLRSHAHHTPEERRRRIVRHLPQAERPVTAITRMYMTERYSPASEEGTAEGARNAQIATRAWGHARRSIIFRWLRRKIPFLRE